jgi:hypothetical protein
MNHDSFQLPGDWELETKDPSNLKEKYPSHQSSSAFGQLSLVEEEAYLGSLYLLLPDPEHERH